VELGLPHRAPFILVDSVDELAPGRATGRKSFSAADPVLTGHFPGQPIVPGVLLTESLAQLAGVAAGAERAGARFLLSAIRTMKFPAAAGPDETISLSATKRGEMGGLWQFDVLAAVGDRTVAEGVVILNEVTPDA